MKHNIIPLIAHPERNRDIQADYQKFLLLAKTGCLFQLTAASIIGDFGESAQQMAYRIIEEDKATLVASDMHSVKRRPPKMMAAFQQINSDFSSIIADILFMQTPMLIAKSLFDES